MGKIVLFLLLSKALFLEADTLKSNCLSCHSAQQIPSDLIYRRYLLNYSTAQQIENAMFDYLKNPQKSTSIMPPQFFLKFPMKKASQLNDTTLHQAIKAYIEQFDIKKKLILKKSSH